MIKITVDRAELVAVFAEWERRWRNREYELITDREIENLSHESADCFLGILADLRVEKARRDRE